MGGIARQSRSMMDSGSPGIFATKIAWQYWRWIVSFFVASRILSECVVSLQGTITSYKWRRLPRAVVNKKMNMDISVHIAPSCVSKRANGP
jgi:hypothetical protein